MKGWREGRGKKEELRMHQWQQKHRKEKNENNEMKDLQKKMKEKRQTLIEYHQTDLRYNPNLNKFTAQEWNLLLSN